MANRQTIAVDFDGVIHAYSRGWQGGEIYDPPIPGAFDALLAFHERGYKVVIFTARPAAQVGEWMIKNWPFKMFDVPEVTNTKPAAIAYIDDRAVKFTNWKEMLDMFPWKSPK